ncbi:hypothetical protein BJX76DRAFT_321818, partial [Aspergillus varians]
MQILVWLLTSQSPTEIIPSAGYARCRWRLLHLKRCSTSGTPDCPSLQPIIMYTCLEELYSHNIVIAGFPLGVYGT